MAGFTSLKLVSSYFGAMLTVVIVVQLVNFISHLPATATPSFDDEPDKRPGTTWIILHDISLLCCFFFFHSFLADASVKSFFERNGLYDIQRNFYVIISCFSLQFLLYFWKPIPWIVLWNLSISSNDWLWWGYTFTHGIIWLHVYAGNLLLDVPELLGIKQVLYSGQNLSYQCKSQSLQQLQQHLPHTSFLDFSILFWMYPHMKLDRAIFAVLLQLYMIINWRPDASDLKYIKEQFESKKLHLKSQF